MSNQLWEILIPTSNLSHQIDWSTKVRNLAGGLTRGSEVHGEWVNPEGQVIIETMIPVKIKCSFLIMEEIVKYSAELFEQQAIMYYLVSDHCYIAEFY